MRIAISGTHGVGKTTLIEEFMRRHPEFLFEPEPYTVLVEDYGEEFSSEPTVDDFHRQLEFNVERLRFHKDDGMVIYERCPVDFLAYILALRDLKTEHVDSTFIERVIEIVLDAIQHLDLIVFLPIEEEYYIEDNSKLRTTVNSQLFEILSGDEFGIVSSGLVTLIGASGSTTERLRILEHAILFN
jgi:predicted ATPase